jgi:hypothetical protein
MPEPAVERAVPLSVAALQDGDGGEITIPSTWRHDVSSADAGTDAVEITTKNQRWDDSSAPISAKDSRALFRSHPRALSHADTSRTSVSLFSSLSRDPRTRNTSAQFASLLTRTTDAKRMS